MRTKQINVNKTKKIRDLFGDVISLISHSFVFTLVLLEKERNQERGGEMYGM